MTTYEQQQNKKEMKQQVLVFLAMIFYTVLAFSMVYLEFDVTFIVPMLLLLAGVQTSFQLTYFMHLKEPGHGVIWLFLSTGALITFVMIIAFLTIIWW